MSPTRVEQLLIQDARLLARRDSPVIDTELEQQRQAALEVFYQWQDGLVQFQDLMPFVAVLDKKVKLNQELIRWEQRNMG